LRLAPRSNKKAGLATGFYAVTPGITWREQQEQQERQEQQRQRQEQQREQQRQQREQQLQEREPGQQLQEREPGQQLLLFCRKRSWKRPGERPAERSISFIFP
jgi:hypothetical protein